MCRLVYFDFIGLIILLIFNMTKKEFEYRLDLKAKDELTSYLHTFNLLRNGYKSNESTAHAMNLNRSRFLSMSECMSFFHVAQLTIVYIVVNTDSNFIHRKRREKFRREKHAIRFDS